MKRYSWIDNISTVGQTVTTNNEYAPQQTSAGNYIKRSFLFWRGGVRFMVFPTATPIAVIMGRWSIAGQAAFSPHGEAATIQGPPGSIAAFSIPWTDVVAFRSIYEAGGENYCFDIGSTLPPSNYKFYSSVRDDYRQGFLIPPDIIV